MWDQIALVNEEVQIEIAQYAAGPCAAKLWAAQLWPAAPNKTPESALEYLAPRYKQ